MKKKGVLFLGFVLSVFLFQISSVRALDNLSGRVDELCPVCADFSESSAVHLLEYGRESLVARAWLTQASKKTIDIQYFIWSTDNVGILAAEALLVAANRGVKIRVIVDDLLIDAEDTTLLLLSAHPNVQIKVYNPNYNVGQSFFTRAFNLVTDFRATNQRMHDKVVVFDGEVAITGGRNMADEYYDFNAHYNFRDRDVLVVGKPVRAMAESFNAFWEHELSVSVEQIFERVSISSEQVNAHYQKLHAYAKNDDNFDPAVRQAIEQYGASFATILNGLSATDVVFISDKPGKNTNTFSLGGGSVTADRLLVDMQGAQQSILIQSPYLILSDELIEVFRGLIKRGVAITILTNSLASTDNLYAFSGYQKQRQELLEIGIQLFEFKPILQSQVLAALQHNEQADDVSVMAIHAKSMVIDGAVSYVGTFNLDPRSANLNTEAGLIITDVHVSAALTQSILTDASSANSWKVTSEFNPDEEVAFSKRVKSRLYGFLPLDALL